MTEKEWHEKIQDAFTKYYILLSFLKYADPEVYNAHFGNSHKLWYEWLGLLKQSSEASFDKNWSLQLGQLF